MRRFRVLFMSGLAVVFTLALSLATMSRASASAFTTTSSLVSPISLTVFIPCAAGGAGEFIDVSGNLHSVFHVTLDNAGGVLIVQEFNPQGISGFGETTGAKYQGTGMTKDTFTAQVNVEESFVNNFRMIGQGPGNNFAVHEVLHYVIHPDGSVTGVVDSFSETCN